MRWAHSGLSSSQSTLNSRCEYRRWLDSDWHAFCQAICKGIEGQERKKPSECQQAKALWAVKAAWERSEEDYDPARKADILGSVGRTSQIPDGGPGKRWIAGKILLGLAFGFTVCH